MAGESRAGQGIGLVVGRIRIQQFLGECFAFFGAEQFACGFVFFGAGYPIGVFEALEMLICLHGQEDGERLVLPRYGHGSGLRLIEQLV